MFEKTMAEAKYLKAAAVLNEEFESELAAFVKQTTGNSASEQLAEDFVLQYLDKLWFAFN